MTEPTNPDVPPEDEILTPATPGAQALPSADTDVTSDDDAE